MSSDNKGVIVVLMGIPCSGKSQFVDLFKNYVRKNKTDMRIFHVNYDDLIPLEIQKKISLEAVAAAAEGASSTPQDWKNYRVDIKNALITIIKNNMGEKKKNDNNHASSSSLSFITQNLKRVFDHFHSNGSQNIIIIDDNNYYRSMRYEYFQVARDVKYGFMTICMKLDPEIAIERNSKHRNNIVPPNVIISISEKLEKPEPQENKWEIYSITIERKTDKIPFYEIDNMLEEALKNPFQKEKIDELKLEEQHRDRLICSTNVLHKADKMLRNKIGLEMSLLKKNNSIDMKSTSRRFNKHKNDILNELKNDRQFVIMKNQNDDEELRTIIEKLFENRIKEFT